MKKPDYPREKYNDAPPFFRQWNYIYTVVLSTFVATLFVIYFFPCWF